MKGISLSVPGGVFYVAGDKVGIVRLDAFKTSKEIQFAVQSGANVDGKQCN